MAAGGLKNPVDGNHALETSRLSSKLRRTVPKGRRRSHIERTSAVIPGEACHLDCGHVPLQKHETEENGRSDDQIPEQLWSWIAPSGAKLQSRTSEYILDM